MQPQNLSENLDLYHYHDGTTGFSDFGTHGFPTNYDFPAVTQSLCNSSFYSLDMSDITDSTPEARALAASQQHKEAERRRRERINSHLDELRTLLPCNSKVTILYCTIFPLEYIFLCSFLLSYYESKKRWGFSEYKVVWRELMRRCVPPPILLALVEMANPFSHDHVGYQQLKAIRFFFWLIKIICIWLMFFVSHRQVFFWFVISCGDVFFKIIIGGNIKLGSFPFFFPWVKTDLSFLKTIITQKSILNFQNW